MGIVGIILGAALLVVQFGVPVALAGRANESREAGGGRGATVALWVARAATAINVGLLVVVPVALAYAFAAVAGADSASKATMLARGISTAMNCGFLFVLLAWLLIGTAAGVLSWSRRRGT